MPTWRWLSLLLAVPACGGGDGIPIGDLGARLIDAICAREVRCGLYADKATCAKALAAIGDEGQLEADVNAGRTLYDAKAAADCLDSYGSTSGIGSCSNTESLSSPGLPVCGQALVGTLATGAGCYDADECVSGTCDKTACVSTTTCCMGVCVAALTEVPIGGDCSALATTCAVGAFCQTGTGGTATCVAEIAAGQPCVNLTDCAPGSLCVPDETTGVKTCGRLPAEGAPCAMILFCEDGRDYCDGTTGLCTRRAATGGACSAGTTGCLPDATCDTATTTCVLRGDTGAACTLATDCIGGTCTANVCVARTPATVCP